VRAGKAHTEEVKVAEMLAAADVFILALQGLNLLGSAEETTAQVDP
jgi:hypothetical protein